MACFGTWRCPTSRRSTATRACRRGLYAKLIQPVIAGRAPKQAIVYFGANAGPGAARPAYIAEVLAAARSWPLPAAGIEALERIAGRSM